MNQPSSTRFTTTLFATAFALVPALAQAHPGHLHAAGLSAGAAHPLLGLDHLLAMIAVGLWATQLGGRAVWLIPTAFLSLMSLGGAIGMAGLQVPLIEQGILASVVVLGVLTASAARLPLILSAAIVGAFALFHGAAHGAEMPASASAMTYSVGFIATTAILHTVGIGFGHLAAKMARAEWLRVAGAAITLAAIVLSLH